MTTQHATLTRPRGRGIGIAALHAVLPFVAISLRLVALSYGSLRWLLEKAPPAIADLLSRERALATARHAARRVPAYRALLAERGLDPDRIEALDELPETDKASYVDRWSLTDRCLDGRIPLRGTTSHPPSPRSGLSS